MKKLFAMLLVLVVMVGCQQAPMTTDPSVISARDAAWQEAMNAGDIDALADLYTDNARLMPPNAPAGMGRDAVRATFSALMEAGFKLKLTNVDAQVSGDLAYNLGTYHVMSGDDVVDAGKYVVTLKLGADGQWRITADIWNSDMPVAVAASDGTRVMLTHEVEDGGHWLAAWRRDDGRREMFAANGMTDVHTFQSVDNPNLTGLEFTGDVEALQSLLSDPNAQAAAAEDGVKLDTMKVFTEAE